MQFQSPSQGQPAKNAPPLTSEFFSDTQPGLAQTGPEQHPAAMLKIWGLVCVPLVPFNPNAKSSENYAADINGTDFDTFDYLAEEAAVVLGDQRLALRIKGSGCVLLDLDHNSGRFLPVVKPDFGLAWGYSNTLSKVVFRCPDAKAAEFKDPEKKDDSQIVSIKVGGASPIPPGPYPKPAKHPGVLLKWWNGGPIEPKTVTATEAYRVAALCAAFDLIASRWKGIQGERQAAALAVAGFFARRNLSEERLAGAMKVVCSIGGDNEVDKRLKAVADTYKNLPTGQNISGLPTLEGIFGEVVAGALAKWFPVGKSGDKPLSEKKPTPSELADAVIAHFDGKLKFLAGEAFAYRAGAWPHVDLSELQHLIDANAGGHSTGGLLTSTMAVLIARCGKFQPYAGSLICVENGVLDPETGALTQHDPDLGMMTKLPVAWDPKAKCPRFDQFLAEIFEGDPHAKQTAACVLQFIGYTLTTNTKYHKSLWLGGDGANGKSTLLEVVKHLVGPENVATVNLSSLGERFGMAAIVGKSLIYAAEMTSDDTVGSGYFKTLVSGETVSVEQKYERGRKEYQNTAKIWATFNEPPQARDHSEGFRRRILYVPFPRTFGTNKDVDLLPKLLTELPGILRRTVEALAVLKQQKDFVPSPTMVGALNDFMKDADPVAQWAEEAIEADKETSSGISNQDLYKEFAGWARDRGRQMITDITFARRLGRYHKGKVTNQGRHWLVKPRFWSKYADSL